MTGDQSCLTQHLEVVGYGGLARLLAEEPVGAPALTSLGGAVPVGR